MVDYNTLVSYKNKNNKVPNNLLDTNFNYIDSILNRIQTNGESLPAKNWRAEKPTFIKAQKKSIREIIEGDINVELNKLSPKNHKEITQKILDNFILKFSGEKKSQLLSFTLDNIFTKAVSQPIYCPYYVIFLKIFIENGVDVKDVIKQKCDKFKNILTKSSSDSRVEQVTSENYDEFCDNLKQKNFKLGYSQFVGELYNNKLISVIILLESIDILICNINEVVNENGDMKSEFVEDNIICCCKIIETLKDKLVVETYSEKLESIKKTKNLPKRLMFSLMDTIESIGTD